MSTSRWRDENSTCPSSVRQGKGFSPLASLTPALNGGPLCRFLALFEIGNRETGAVSRASGRSWGFFKAGAESRESAYA